ncbi:head-tail connector protein [Methylobrevis pamukkalensis]|uniref:Phage gp6-like head-tail connector protein n=1 Tax=Methylobrevis pamukkalensis TaxID=1439726 RepID=A0A1E3GXQ5_9HYPH|nr:head-tail connector protein [Methylobrevis pamukkalensis]ODN68847.1 Phage gp6-like head-tail connector protein [Methylobrevis pamukkalensis]
MRTSISDGDIQEYLNLEADEYGGAGVYLPALKAAATSHIEAQIGKTLQSFVDDEGEIPGGLYTAALMLIGHLYENREASIVGVSIGAVPFGFDDLVRPYRTWVFA